MPIGDKITKANNGVLALPTKLASNKGISDVTAELEASTGWPQDSTDGPVHFALFKVDPSDETKVADNSLSFWKATLTGTTLSNMQQTGGPILSYDLGDSALITSTPGFINDFSDAMLTQHNRNGTHKDITSTNATITNLAVTNLTVGSQVPSADWSTLGGTPGPVVHNGNLSYDVQVLGSDLTNTIQPGSRLKFTRTVGAPTQCTLLNGTNQYWQKTGTINKMTFVDDFAVGAWIKLTSYPSSIGSIVSRYNGTSGWRFDVMANGQVRLQAYNAGAANFSSVQSIQSVPLNKWVYLSAQLDMSAFTNFVTSSYIMFNGVDVPADVSRGGTNPTQLVQAGNLEIGSANATDYLPARIAQVAVFGAKIAQTSFADYMNQGLSGNEPNIASAYSFNGVTTDLSTTSPNNLAAQGGVLATYADSPYGGQANGKISSTLDYGIVQSVSYSTNTVITVHAAEGCTIPTTGGVSAISYSTTSVPFGFPSDADKFTVSSLYCSDVFTTGSPANGVWYYAKARIIVPVGRWKLGYDIARLVVAGSANVEGNFTLSSSSSSATIPRLQSHVFASTVNAQVPSSRLVTTTIPSTTVYFFIQAPASTNVTTIGLSGSQGFSELLAINSYA